MNSETELINEKIESINSRFFSALDDYKKYYVYYNKNPEVSEFQNYYSNSKSQLLNISKELVNLTNNINKKIISLDVDMSEITKKIDKEKLKNAKMKRLLNNLEISQNGSEILIDDSKKEYNEQYYINLELLVGIGLLGIVLKVLFKPTTPNV